VNGVLARRSLPCGDWLGFKYSFLPEQVKKSLENLDFNYDFNSYFTNITALLLCCAANIMD